MTEFKELKKQLRKEYPDDYALILERFGDFKYWIYGRYDDAQQHYNRMCNSMIADDKDNKFWVEQMR